MVLRAKCLMVSILCQLAKPQYGAKAKRVIYLFMGGAPSHLELFDNKPELSKWDGKLPPPDLLKGYRAAFINPKTAEALGIKEGLYRKFKQAHGFYGIIALAIVAGLIINFLGIDPIQALIFTAVFNAVASVPLLWMIYRVGNNRDVMGEYKNSRWSNAGVLSAFIVMAIATLVLFWSLIPR